MLYYLDENISFRVARVLREAGINALTVSFAGMRGKSDIEQLEYATQLGRVLVTHDRDFVDLALQKSGHAGVIYAWNLNVSQEALCRELIHIHKTKSSESMRDQLITLGIE